MKTLQCEQCSKKIDSEQDEDWGIKFNGLYFCSLECLDEYVSWRTQAISYIDFEQDEQDEEEDEVINDYDIQGSYLNN